MTLALRRPLLAVAAVTSLALCAGLMALAKPTPTPTPAPAPPAAPVIATVDLESIIKQLKEREDKEKALETAQKDAQKKINDLAEEAKSAKTKFDNEPEGPGKVEMAKQVREKLIRAEFEKQYAEKVLGEMKGEMLRELYNKINAAVAKLAKQNNYDLVLTSDAKVDVNASDPDSILRAIALKRILYVNPNLDITDDIVKELNNAYAAGPSATTPTKRR